VGLAWGGVLDSLFERAARSAMVMVAPPRAARNPRFTTLSLSFFFVVVVVVC
jgi:hypothetical protein